MVALQCQEFVFTSLEKHLFLQKWNLHKEGHKVRSVPSTSGFTFHPRCSLPPTEFDTFVLFIVLGSSQLSFLFFLAHGFHPKGYLLKIAATIFLWEVGRRIARLPCWVSLIPVEGYSKQLLSTHYHLECNHMATPTCKGAGRKLVFICYITAPAATRQAGDRLFGGHTCLCHLGFMAWGTDYVCQTPVVTDIQGYFFQNCEN